MLQWLQHTFQFTSQEAKSNNSFLLRRAACQGHLKVLQWLHATYQFTSENARSCCNEAFLWAAGNGHLAVIQWLHQTYELNLSVRLLVGAIDLAAMRNHTPVHHWIKNTFNVEKLE